MKLIHGDCLDYIQDVKADIIISDMPYGVTNCRWDTTIDLDKFWSVVPTDKAVLFAQCPFDIVLGYSNIENLKYEIVWEKSKASGFLNAKRRPLSAHENILVFGNVPYYPVMGSGAAYNKGIRKAQDSEDAYGEYDQTEVKSDGCRYPRSVVYFRTAESEGKFHKTQKPIALMEYLVKTYSKEGDTVLDPFMGSGTTGLACKNLGRNFIGIEKDDDIFKVAQGRLK